MISNQIPLFQSTLISFRVAKKEKEIERAKLIAKFLTVNWQIS